jgi:3-methyladenine DNA glycosylase AlkC
VIDDVRGIIEKGIHSLTLSDVLLEIRKLASNKSWKKREEAATALVEISKNKEDDVFIHEMIIWAEDKDPNIRRAASEGLRINLGPTKFIWCISYTDLQLQSALVPQYP